MEQVEIHTGIFVLEVEGEWYGGCKETRMEPAEASQFTPARVFMWKTVMGKDGLAHKQRIEVTDCVDDWEAVTGFCDEVASGQIQGRREYDRERDKEARDDEQYPDGA
jgi:hypothetical protein